MPALESGGLSHATCHPWVVPETPLSKLFTVSIAAPSFGLTKYIIRIQKGTPPPRKKERNYNGDQKPQTPSDSLKKDPAQPIDSRGPGPDMQPPNGFRGLGSRGLGFRV